MEERQRVTRGREAETGQRQRVASGKEADSGQEKKGRAWPDVKRLRVAKG